MQYSKYAQYIFICNENKYLYSCSIFASWSFFLQPKPVGGLEHDFYFPIKIGNVIIPIDELNFSEG